MLQRLGQERNPQNKVGQVIKNHQKDSPIKLQETHDPIPAPPPSQIVINVPPNRLTSHLILPANPRSYVQPQKWLGNDLLKRLNWVFHLNRVGKRIYWLYYYPNHIGKYWFGEVELLCVLWDILYSPRGRVGGGRARYTGGEKGADSCG